MENTLSSISTPHQDNEQSRKVLEAIDHVFIFLRDSQLDKKALKAVKKDLELLSLFLNGTKREAILFAIIFSLNLDRVKVTTHQVCDYLGISLVQFASMLTECKNMVERQILTGQTPERSGNNVQLSNVWYSVHRNYWEKLQVQLRSESESPAEAEKSQFLEFMGQFADEVADNLYYHGYEEIVSKVNDLISKASDNPFLTRLEQSGLSETDKLVVLMLLYAELTQEDDISFGSICTSLSLPFAIKVQLRHQLVTGTHPLIEAGKMYYSPSKEDYPATLKLDQGYIKELITEDYRFTEYKESTTRFVNVYPSDKINEVPLFYNSEEENQIRFLDNLLNPQKYEEVTSRLTTHGFSSGITVLLHGKPGTGKTESVLQIARKTGRAVMRVEMSSIESMWVGESEKNLKALFENYREEVRKNLNNCPILLFNEADALFSKRLQVQSTVGQMHNRLQNILLQELEEFKGILIATTNLIDNLDGAFERRFLYKIKFETPDLKTRTQIWKYKLSNLSEIEAQKIASEFNFSGGQIENISRKYILQHLVAGETFSFDVIRNLCLKELLMVYPKIGF